MDGSWAVFICTIFSTSTVVKLKNLSKIGYSGEHTTKLSGICKCILNCIDDVASRLMLRVSRPVHVGQFWHFPVADFLLSKGNLNEVVEASLYIVDR